MKEMLVKVIKDEDGQGMVEYGLIIAGIALAAIAAIAVLKPILETVFTNTSTNISNGISGTPAE